ncbi:MAG: hypothetical protein FWC42_10530 [Proteobacteria bacterium]|nr:hypothetical protein [Pseudomonadota bacterium]
MDIAVSEISDIRREPLPSLWKMMFFGADDPFVVKMVDDKGHFLVLQRGSDAFERAVSAAICNQGYGFQTYPAQQKREF